MFWIGCVVTVPNLLGPLRDKKRWVERKYEVLVTAARLRTKDRRKGKQQRCDGMLGERLELHGNATGLGRAYEEAHERR
jgi:hypothetical protein